jgi:hypothetical protein
MSRKLERTLINMNFEYVEPQNRSTTLNHHTNPLGPISAKKTVLILLLTIIGLGIGCATPPLDPGLTGPFHKIGNYYLINKRLPPEVRKVAMLPLTSALKDQSAVAGRESLQPILFGELSKSRLFEVLLVTNERLEEWTGKPSRTQDEELPADFLIKIKEETGCDAILFNHLTYYRPYPPMAIGWRLLLVRTDGEVLWTLDEVFDAGEPLVANSVRRYALQSERSNAELTYQAGTRSGAAWSSRIPGWEWVNSPTSFGKYTANAAVETLSAR